MQRIPPMITPYDLDDPSREKAIVSGDLTRRRFLSLSKRILLAATLSATAGLLRPLVAQADAGKGERTLNCYNANTREHLQATYWADGRYRLSGLEQIYYFFRDYHENKYIDISTDLIEMIYDLSSLLDCHEPFVLLSGYRTPRTNALLYRRSRGVALHSYHTTGEAADIYLPGCHLRELHAAAKHLEVGGVGLYPRKHYIHVDVGPIRYWRG